MRCSAHIMRLVRNRGWGNGWHQNDFINRAEKRDPVVKPPALENNLKSVADSSCSFRHTRNSLFASVFLSMK